MPDRSEIRNLAAGPSPLPTPVLQKAAEGLLNYNNSGMGICEISHRSKDFMAIIKGAEANMRKLLSVPDNYAILFAQGGATTQFSSTLLNLLAAHRLSQASASTYSPPTVDYVVTGSWSSKAYAEAQRLALPSTPGAAPLFNVNLAATSKPSKYTTLPQRTEYKITPDAAMIYYCENETINGIEFPSADNQSSPYAFPFDLVPEGVPIVGDYSSSFLSRPIPHIERHAIIVAGAQKNLGPAGVTVIIVRKDLLVDTTEAMKLGGVPAVPIQNEYKILADNDSLSNTPPVYAIYISALVLEYLLEQGGMDNLDRTNREKARQMYEILDEAEEKGLVRCVVREKEARSWMNITFEVPGREDEFVKGAEAKGFRQIKGHRSVGGVRTSLYNAVPLSSVEELVAYIKSFIASA